MKKASYLVAKGLGNLFILVEPTYLQERNNNAYAMVQLWLNKMVYIKGMEWLLIHTVYIIAIVIKLILYSIYPDNK